jgi:hypothetical protein
VINSENDSPEPIELLITGEPATEDEILLFETLAEQFVETAPITTHYEYGLIVGGDLMITFATSESSGDSNDILSGNITISSREHDGDFFYLETSPQEGASVLRVDSSVGYAGVAKALGVIIENCEAEINVDEQALLRHLQSSMLRAEFDESLGEDFLSAGSAAMDTGDIRKTNLFDFLHTLVKKRSPLGIVAQECYPGRNQHIAISKHDYVGLEDDDMELAVDLPLFSVQIYDPATDLLYTYERVNDSSPKIKTKNASEPETTKAEEFSDEASDIINDTNLYTPSKNDLDFMYQALSNAWQEHNF